MSEVARSKHFVEVAPFFALQTLELKLVSNVFFQRHGDKLSIYRPGEALLWKSFRLCPDHTAGKQLNTQTNSFSIIFLEQLSLADQRSPPTNEKLWTNQSGLTSEFPGAAVGQLLLSSVSGSVCVCGTKMGQDPNEGGKVHRFLSEERGKGNVSCFLFKVTNTLRMDLILLSNTAVVNPHNPVTVCHVKNLMSLFFNFHCLLLSTFHHLILLWPLYF